jgi:hypothetical protein
VKEMDPKDLKERLIGELHDEIDYSEKKMWIDKDLDSIIDNDYRNLELFIARSKAVKKFSTALLTTYSDIKDKYGKELRLSKEKYPTAWMLSDEPVRSISIMQNLKRFPLMFPLLNYLFELTRHVRGYDLNQMIKLTDRITGRKKHVYENSKGKIVERDFAIFLTNKEFYRKAEKTLGYSEVYIKKFIQAFTACGILKRLGRDGKIGWLYSDGFYTPTQMDRLRKHSFLKDTTAYRRALRNFSPGKYSASA